MKFVLFLLFTIAAFANYAAPVKEAAVSKGKSPAAKEEAPRPIRKLSACQAEHTRKCFDHCKAHCNNGVGNGADCRPGRARYSNDDHGGLPGNPGARGGGAAGTEYATSNKGDNTIVNADLVFEGTIPDTIRRTKCQDLCEDEPVCAEKEVEPKPAVYGATPVVEVKPTVCQLTPRDAVACEAEAKKANVCDACVTTKCKTCRKVYVQLCTAPQRFADVEACLRLSDAAADKARTRNAIAALCKEQTCVEAPAAEVKPAVYGAPAAPGVCQLTPRDAATCEAEAKKANVCDACVTTRCKTCRKVYVQLCSAPQRFADVEACLRLSDTAADKTRTRNAIATLCREQTCVEAPAAEVKPAVYGAPAAPAVCQLVPRDAVACESEAKKAEVCGDCVTTQCKSCRRVYIQLCTAPQRFADLESCLRLSDAAANKQKTRNAIATLCREQTCVEAAAPPAPEAPKVVAPQVPPQADPKVIIPPPVPAGTCTPTKARNLKIRGSGKQCDDAKKLREQIKNLREKVNCILSAFEGKIPEVVTVIKAAPLVENIPKHSPTVQTEEKKEARVFVEKVVANYATPTKGKSIHIVPAPAGYKAEVKPVEKVTEVKAAQYNAPKAASRAKSVRKGASIKKAKSVKVKAVSVKKAYGGAKAVSKKAESRGRSRKAKSVKKYKARSGTKARKGRSNRRRNGREPARSQRKQRRARSARKNGGRYGKSKGRGRARSTGRSRRARSGNNGRRVRQPAPRPAAKAY